MKGIGAWALSVMAVLLLAVLGAGCGGGGGEAASAEPPSSPTGKAEAANFDGVHSGEFELAFEAERYKKHREEVRMRILGTFIKGEEALPEVDLAIESNGKLAGREIAFLTGPLLLPDKWILNFEGKVYQPDPGIFRETKAKFEEAQQEEGGEGNVMACVEAAEGFSLTDAVHKVSFEGTEESLDGVKLELLGADLNPSAVLDELIEIGESSPGCQAQLEAVGVPPAADLERLERELQGSLGTARLTLGLDKHGLARYLKVLANVELPHNQELELELVMRLTRVNEVTGLPITHGYEPFPALLKQFGLAEQDVKEADAGEIYVSILRVIADRLFGQEG